MAVGGVENDAEIGVRGDEGMNADASGSAVGVVGSAEVGVEGGKRPTACKQCVIATDNLLSGMCMRE